VPLAATSGTATLAAWLQVVQRYASTTAPAAITGDIEKLLG
jgi:hypothetical protein